MLIIPLIISLYVSLFHHPADKKDRKRPIVTEQVRSISDEDSRRYQYYWLEAVRQEGMGNYAEAYDLYNHCLHINPDAAETHHNIARFESAFGNDSLALMHYESAVRLDPANDEFAEKLGEYYLSSGMIAKGAEVYEKLSAMFPDRSGYLEMLSRIYQHEKDYSKMLDVLNRLETVEGQSEDLTLSKMQVYSNLGNKKSAERELSLLIKNHPNDPNYKVMKGNWYLSMGMKKEALKEFLDVLKDEPDNASAQMSLLDYYRADGNTEEADKLLYRLLENPDTEPQTRITLMRQVVMDNEQGGGDSIKVLDIFNHILAMPQKTSELAEMKVAYMALKQMPSDSIKSTLHQVLDINPENVQARLQLLDIMWKDTIDENVIRECEKAIDYNPEQTALYYYLGLAKYLTEDNAGALTALQQGTATITDDTPDNISSRMYMIMGDIFHQMGRTEDAFAAYDSCLTYDPDEISCLNNYAYYLSEQNRDLKRAEQMSYKTIKAEPKNGTYLDTYAWILYMQERYEEAKIYIDQIIKVDSTSMSAVLYDHAGDIYFKTGDVKQAVEYWQKALEMQHENADEIRKKIDKTNK